MLEEVIPANPWAAVHLGLRSRSGGKRTHTETLAADADLVLDPAQVRALAAACVEHGSWGPMVMAFVLVMGLCGLRPDEAAGVLVGDLELPKRGSGLGPAQGPGADRRATGPIPPELVTVLRRHLEAHRPDAGAHDLRHSACSMWLRAGVDVTACQKCFPDGVFPAPPTQDGERDYPWTSGAGAADPAAMDTQRWQGRARKLMTLAVAGLVATAGCGGDEPATADSTTTTSDAATTLGEPTTPPQLEDAEQARLAAWCFDGSLTDCDELYFGNLGVQEADDYGATCGGRLAEGVFGQCALDFGPTVEG